MESLALLSAAIAVTQTMSLLPPASPPSAHQCKAPGRGKPPSLTFF